jgi:hypothetical protein
VGGAGDWRWLRAIWPRKDQKVQRSRVSPVMCEESYFPLLKPDITNPSKPIFTRPLSLVNEIDFEEKFLTIIIIVWAILSPLFKYHGWTSRW